MFGGLWLKKAGCGGELLFRVDWVVLEVMQVVLLVLWLLSLQYLPLPCLMLCISLLHSSPPGYGSHVNLLRSLLPYSFVVGVAPSMNVYGSCSYVSSILDPSFNIDV